MGAADAGLRKIFAQHLPRIDWCAIESGATSRGIPDTNGCAPGGIEFWLEMKACDHWRVTIRPEQVGWIERRLDHGAKVFIAVRRAQYELWLFPGGAIRLLVTERLDAVPRLGVWRGGAACWDWIAIGKLLVT